VAIEVLKIAIRRCIQCPLIILVNIERIASEIFAAALQDYGA